MYSVADNVEIAFFFYFILSVICSVMFYYGPEKGKEEKLATKGIEF